MLFHEIYGTYFQVVADILTEAVQGCLTDQHLTNIVQQKAFAESALSIPTALKKQEWPLLTPTLGTVVHHKPTMPLTTLEKRWLKALLLDKRIALFQPDCTGLEDVEPLYQPETFVFFDQYTDGDPYTDTQYIQCFQTILQALHEKKMLKVEFFTRTHAKYTIFCQPNQLEYSSKDDKFRLIAFGKQNTYTINLARIQSCEIMEEPPSIQKPVLPRQKQKELTFLLYNQRNALERVLLHFSHFHKETTKLDSGQYRIKLHYHPDDETELLIRVLSFGPMIQVEAPQEFIDLLQERVHRQLDYFSKNRTT